MATVIKNRSIEEWKKWIDMEIKDNTGPLTLDTYHYTLEAFKESLTRLENSIGDGRQVLSGLSKDKQLEIIRQKLRTYEDVISDVDIKFDYKGRNNITLYIDNTSSEHDIQIETELINDFFKTVYVNNLIFRKVDFSKDLAHIENTTIVLYGNFLKDVMISIENGLNLEFAAHPGEYDMFTLNNSIVTQDAHSMTVDVRTIREMRFEQGSGLYFPRATVILNPEENPNPFKCDPQHDELIFDRIRVDNFCETGDTFTVYNPSIDTLPEKEATEKTLEVIRNL